MSKAIHSGFFSRKAAICLYWGWMLLLPAAVFGQAYYQTNGTEYAVVGSLMGDQVLPDMVLNSSGGFIVWQDNITDGSGWGVSAMHLIGTSGSGSSFRVNVQGTNDQANARVSLLQNGGAVFVWQGGKPGQEQIYARFLSPTNTWLTTGDLPISAQIVTNVSFIYNYTTNQSSTITTNWNLLHTKITGYITNTTPPTVTTTITTNTTVNTVNFQINPAVATLANGNVIIVWGSFDQAGSNSLQDVYGQILSPAGVKIGAVFLVNQFTTYNQRTPTVAALANGGFVVAWVSEQERVVGVPNANAVAPNQQAYPSIDLYARLYDANGSPLGNEFLVNADSNPCAHPAVAAGTDGGFMVAWDAKDMSSPTTNSLDIYARSFTGAGAGSGSTVVRVNTRLYGDEYAPRISSLGTDYLVVWTSLAQDGSREGVYAQFLRGNGSEFGGEFRVNTTTLNSQMEPVVASDGASQFVVVWTSYTGAPYSFDLYAQRYINVSSLLTPMAAPFVSAPFVVVSNKYQPQLQVSWPPLLGISVASYEIFVDGAGTNMGVTTSNVWTMTAANGLAASSTHFFQVAYVTTDGRTSPLSPSASGTAWNNCNYMNSGVPCDWIAEMYTTNPWPSNVNAPIVPGGPTVYQVFLSGGNPLDPGTWLQTTLTRTAQGLFLSWNPQPGLTYQVQMTTNLTTWSNLGAPRFAAGTSDSMYVGSGPAAYYRILLLYQ